MKGVKKLIRERASAGEHVSEGTFSLDPEKAMLKLAKFGLDSPESVVLRLIQEFYKAGFGRLQISLGRDFVALEFTDVDDHTLELSDLGGKVELETATLPTVLWSSVFNGFESGTVVNRHKGWRFTEEGFVSVENSKGKPGTVKVELQRQRIQGFWPRLKAFVSGRCLEHKMFTEKLVYCPNPVILDGRELTSHERPECNCLIELFLEGPSGLKTVALSRPVERAYRFQAVERSISTGSWSWKTYMSVRRACRFGRQRKKKDVLLAHFWVPCTRWGKGRIVFVSDGVIVGAVQPDFPLPVFGVVSAHELSLDLSKLGLIHNDKLEKYMAYVLKILEKSARRIKAKDAPQTVISLLRVAGFLKDEKKKKGSKRTKPRSGMLPDPRLMGRQPHQFDHKRADLDFQTQRRHLRSTGRFK